MKRCYRNNVTYYRRNHCAQNITILVSIDTILLFGVVRGIKNGSPSWANRFSYLEENDKISKRTVIITQLGVIGSVINLFLGTEDSSKRSINRVFSPPKGA
jgi:hypothetical protein